jgi:hypothetical protein
LIVFLFTPFFLFLVPERTSLAICDSTSASKAASVNCFISGAKSPSLPVRFLPLLNCSKTSLKGTNLQMGFFPYAI